MIINLFLLGIIFRAFKIKKTLILNYMIILNLNKTTKEYILQIIILDIYFELSQRNQNV
jgi:phosphate starvation-inducible membrane PsiE